MINNSIKLQEKEGIVIPPLENVFQNGNWINQNNKISINKSLQDKINDFFNYVYKNYPNRIVISFRKQHQYQAKKGVDLRKELGYGDDIIMFFKDFGFYYDYTGKLAFDNYQNQDHLPIKEEIEQFPSYSVATIDLSKIYINAHWNPLSNKKINEKIQESLDKLLNKILEIYPTRMIYMLNTNYRRIAEDLLPPIRNKLGYKNNFEFFFDFGFFYMKSKNPEKNLMEYILGETDQKELPYFMIAIRKLYEGHKIRIDNLTDFILFWMEYRYKETKTFVDKFYIDYDEFAYNFVKSFDLNYIKKDESLKVITLSKKSTIPNFIDNNESMLKELDDKVLEQLLLLVKKEKHSFRTRDIQPIFMKYVIEFITLRDLKENDIAKICKYIKTLYTYDLLDEYKIYTYLYLYYLKTNNNVYLSIIKFCRTNIENILYFVFDKKIDLSNIYLFVDEDDSDAKLSALYKRAMQIDYNNYLKEDLIKIIKIFYLLGDYKESKNMLEKHIEIFRKKFHYEPSGYEN